MDGIGFLKTLTLSSMVLEVMPTTPAFATALYAGNANACPSHVLGDSRLRRIPTSCAAFKPSNTLSRRRRPASWGRTQDPPRCLLPSTASADAGREEDTWIGNISGGAADTGDAPFFAPSIITAAAAATATAAAAATATTGGAGGAGGGDGIDSRGDREAFTFASKPLPEGTTLRPMLETDIDSVVGLAFEEFYEGPVKVENVRGVKIWEETWRRAKLNGSFQDDDVEELTDWFEMIWLRAVIRWGFGMRARIGNGGQDHKVFCVTDGKGEERPDSGGDLVAVAEVSLQVPNGRTAPPFPVPLVVKKLMAWPGPVMPYISNVLVNPSVRRQGLAKKLMLRCEQQARDWGHTQVYLHVDISYWPAVQLYESMGYEVVSMLEVKWEAPALRYMKKTL